VTEPPKGRARRARLLAGGLIGGALVVADQARRRRGPVIGGLRAFEDAPCYREEHPREAPAEERPAGANA
jgi:hypothetical protein